MSVTREMAGEEMAFRWFGLSWSAPVCTEVQHEVTPVGVPCVRCRVAIKEGDQGFMVPRSLFPVPEIGDGTWAAVHDSFHRDCWMWHLGLGNYVPS